MNAVTEIPARSASDGATEPPYRLRKPAQFFAVPTVADMQRFIDQSGQRERVLRMAHAAREVAALAAELGAEAEALEMRALCFRLARSCQLACTAIVRHGLWVTS